MEDTLLIFVQDSASHSHMGHLQNRYIPENAGATIYTHFSRALHTYIVHLSASIYYTYAYTRGVRESPDKLSVDRLTGDWSVNERRRCKAAYEAELQVINYLFN